MIEVDVVNNVVVLGVDDSPGARAALAWAARYAASTGARLRSVHAYEFNLAWIDVASPDLPLWEQRARITAEDALARIVTDVFGGGAPDGSELRAVQGPAGGVLYEEGARPRCWLSVRGGVGDSPACYSGQ